MKAAGRCVRPSRRTCRSSLKSSCQSGTTGLSRSECKAGCYFDAIPNTYIDQQLASVRTHVLRTVIRRSEAINQAQINGEPVLTFDPQGHGAEDFRALTKEVLQHG